MNVYRLLAGILFGSQYRKFEKSCRQGEGAQTEAWQRIRARLAQGTYWPAKVANFAQSSLEALPITDFETYRSILEKSVDETHSPLNGEPIIFWSESSGTTGKAKIYPLTTSFQKEFQLVNGPFLAGVLRNHPTFLKNKTLYFAADLPSRKTKAGVEMGFISAFNYARIPPLFKPKYALPNEAFLNRDLFFEYGTLFALSQRIDTFVAIAPASVERFVAEITQNRERVAAEIVQPKSRPGLPDFSFSQGEQKRLLEVLKKEHITLRDLWPDLRTMICWKTSSCGLQLKNMEPLLTGVQVFDALYSATEGWMTVPDPAKGNGGPLHLGGHVYEFLPEGDEAKPENLLKPGQIKTGKTYEIFLTTSMGFIRYRLHDLVLCTGFFHQSPVLEFRGKEGQALSLGQTRISETHVLTALDAGQLKLPNRWFMMSSEDGKNLVMIVPPGQIPDAKVLAELDHAIRVANPEYEDDRKLDMLLSLKAEELPLDHALWPQASHAQSKPKMFVQGSLNSKF